MCVCACVYVFMYACVYMCVCVRARQALLHACVSYSMLQRGMKGRGGNEMIDISGWKGKDTASKVSNIIILCFVLG